jgi:hypothetical protein
VLDDVPEPARPESTSGSINDQPVRLPVFQGEGLQPGVQLDSTSRLLGLMDGA